MNKCKDCINWHWELVCNFGCGFRRICYCGPCGKEIEDINREVVCVNFEEVEE